MPFLAQHWKIILMLLICWYAYAQKTAHTRAVNELEAFKQNIAELAAKQAHENEIKRIKAELSIKSAQNAHTKQIEDIKNAYAKTHKLTTLTIADLRNRLRQSVSDTFSLPEVGSDTERTTEEWANSYAAFTGQYQTLVDACAITTSDYNLLRGWADDACLQVGCE